MVADTLHHLREMAQHLARDCPPGQEELMDHLMGSHHDPHRRSTATVTVRRISMVLHTATEIGRGTGSETETEHHEAGLLLGQGTMSIRTFRPTNVSVWTATSKTGDDEIGLTLTRAAGREVDHPQQEGCLIERGTIVDRIARLHLLGDSVPHGGTMTVTFTIRRLTWRNGVVTPVFHGNHDNPRGGLIRFTLKNRPLYEGRTAILYSGSIFDGNTMRVIQCVATLMAAAAAVDS